MTTSHAIRVVQDPALSAPTNMARDEALMTLVGLKESVPTLRLYQWDPPAISLGYFQSFAEYEALPPPAGDLSVVRRPTGGGAILHDQELTYSFSLPADHALLSEGPHHLYELAHDAIIVFFKTLGLRAHRGGETDPGPSSGRTTTRRGPFFCFARRHRFDVLIGSDKVAGSAQRRTRDAVLQHGSIILSNRFEQQPTATVKLDYDDAVQRGRMTLAEHLADVSGARFVPGTWSANELKAAEALIPKYAGGAWTKRVG